MLRSLKLFNISLYFLFLTGSSSSVAHPNGVIPGQFRDELRLSAEAQQYLLEYARNLYDSNKKKVAAVNPPKETLSNQNSIIITMFGQDGATINDWRVDGQETSLLQKLATAIPNMRSENRQKERLMGSNLVTKNQSAMGKDSVRGDNVYIHLLVVTYTARFPNFGIRGIFNERVYEPKVTGLAYELNGKRAELSPIEAVVRNLGPNGARAYLAKKLKFDPRKMTKKNDLTIEVYRVQHFGERLRDRKFTQFHRGHAILSEQNISRELIHERLRLVGEWYKNNVIDGEVTFEYSPFTKKYSNQKRSMVRSTMSVWVLNKLAYYLDDPELKELGRQTIRFYLERYFQIEDSLKAGKIIPSPKPLVRGDLVKNRYTTASFMAAALLARDDYQDYINEIDLLNDWMESFQKKDGVFWTQNAMSQYFMPGQLLLSTAINYSKTKRPELKAFFDRSYETYEKAFYQMMYLGNTTYTPYAPGWATQFIAAMNLAAPDQRYSNLIYGINDRMIEWYKLNSRYRVYPDFAGILQAKRSNVGDASTTAAALESLTDAAVLAKKEGDNVRYKKYRNVLRQSVAYLLRLQYTEDNVYFLQKRMRVLGAFKKDLIDGVIWMDSIWHLTSALIKIHEEELI